MRILHLGLCVQPQPFNGFQTAFIDVVGAENYAELSCGETDFNLKAVKLFDEFKPDIVFMQIQAENIIQADTCDYMKTKGAFVINWNGDKRHQTPQWMLDLAPFVNCTSFSNMDDVNYMRSIGFKSEYLEIGYDPLIYTPIGEVAPNVPEIVFMGNNYGHGYFPMSTFRIETVAFLRATYGDRFGVYGSGWEASNGNVNHSQHEEAKIYRGAKIAINISHFDSLNYNSDRLLRILGSGVCCLSYSHKGMIETYGDTINYFDNFGQLKHNIDFYLDYNYNRLGLSGELFVKNMFTFKHQVINIIKLAKL